MFIDSQSTFAAAQAVTATGDTASTNILDTGAAHDEGIGEPLFLLVKTVAGFTSGGAGTLQAVLQTDDNSSFSTPKEFPITGALALAALGANAEIAKYRLPIGLERYLRVVWRVGTAAMTAGSVSAYLVKDVQANVAYASGFSVQ